MHNGDPPTHSTTPLDIKMTPLAHYITPIDPLNDSIKQLNEVFLRLNLLKKNPDMSKKWVLIQNYFLPSGSGRDPLEAPGVPLRRQHHLEAGLTPEKQ